MMERDLAVMTDNYSVPALATLAQRQPTLVVDLQRFLQTHANPTQYKPMPQHGHIVQRGIHDCFFFVDQPEVVAPYLKQIKPGRRCLQMFDSPGQLLCFLQHPMAQACVQHRAWEAWLLLPCSQATHIKQWCRGHHPRDWPWVFGSAKLQVSSIAKLASDYQLALKQTYAGVCQRLASQIKQKQYDGRPSHGQITQAKQRALRVMTLAFQGTSYQVHCARDIAAGLETLGVQTRLLLPEMTCYHDYLLLEAIAEFDPDVLLLNGRGRQQFSALPSRLSVVSWDQDYALSSTLTYAKDMQPCDTLLVMVRDWLKEAIANGVSPKQVRHLNLGTNTQLYKPSGRSVAKQYDILFVGHWYPSDQYKIMIGFDKLDQQVQNLLLDAQNRLADWLTSSPESTDQAATSSDFILPEMETFLVEPARQAGLKSLDEPHFRQQYIHFFRYRMAHMLLREHYIQSLAKYQLGLFGKGWDQVAGVADQAQPTLENGDDLLQAIHRSRICLFLHTWTVHHPRLYDSASAGAMVLVGRVQEDFGLENVFETGQDLDTFGSTIELHQKIDHYLDNPNLCKKMGLRASVRCHQDHRMSQRMAQWLGQQPMVGEDD